MRILCSGFFHELQYYEETLVKDSICMIVMNIVGRILGRSLVLHCRGWNTCPETQWQIRLATPFLSFYFLVQFTLRAHRHEWVQIPLGTRRKHFCSTLFISTLPGMLFSVLLQLFNFLLYLASVMRLSLLTGCSALLTKQEDIFFLLRHQKVVHELLHLFNFQNPNDTANHVIFHEIILFPFSIPLQPRMSVSW